MNGEVGGRFHKIEQVGRHLGSAMLDAALARPSSRGFSHWQPLNLSYNPRTTMKRKDLVRRYRIANDKKFRLKDIDPADTWKLKSSDHAQQWLEEGVTRLRQLQDLLYAQNQWAVLIILQAMDAAGKDGTSNTSCPASIPRAARSIPSKPPRRRSLSHDFLWRTTDCLPERGHIGIFNRSYYEEVLVVRVHPDLLAHEKLPLPLVTRTSGTSGSRTSTPSSATSPQRRGHPQVLPPPLQKGAAAAPPGPPRGTGQELEVLQADVQERHTGMTT